MCHKADTGFGNAVEFVDVVLHFCGTVCTTEVLDFETSMHDDSFLESFVTRVIRRCGSCLDRAWCVRDHRKEHR